MRTLFLKKPIKKKNPSEQIILLIIVLLVVITRAKILGNAYSQDSGKGIRKMIVQQDDVLREEKDLGDVNFWRIMNIFQIIDEYMTV